MSWAEAYELAAELASVQKTELSERLSDRNLVQLVDTLLKRGFLNNLLFTQDGQEYITKDQLTYEIEQELLYSNGRIAITDMCDVINLSIENIEPIVKTLVSENPNELYIVNGDFINEQYLHSVAMEINNKLQEVGYLSFSDMSAKHDLPIKFLTNQVSRYFGKVIDGSYSDNKLSLYTKLYENSQKAKVRGALLACTKPISLHKVIEITGIEESFLLPAFNDLLQKEVIKGTLSGSLDVNGVFIPAVFEKYQKDSVTNILNSTGLISYSQVHKLAISNAHEFIKHSSPDLSLIFLSDCCITTQLKVQLESSLEEIVSESSWLELSFVLPSQLSSTDASALFNLCLRSNPAFEESILLLRCESFVVSQKFAEKCQSLFHVQLKAKAVEDVREKFKIVEKMLTTVSSETSNKKDKRKQDAAVKSKAATTSMAVGGRGGREVKKKAVKNKFRDNRDDEDLADDAPEKNVDDVLFRDALRMTDIENLLEKSFADEALPVELISDLAEHIFYPLRELYQNFLKEEFEKCHQKKITVTDMQNNVKNFISTSSFLEKSLSVFEGSDHFETVNQYLVKTHCVPAFNNLVNLIAEEYSASLADPSKMNPDVRGKIINQIKKDSQRSCLSDLNSNLVSFPEFITSFTECCNTCDVYVGKPDKKKEKQTLTEHSRNLELQIEVNQNLPDLLLQCCLLLFCKHHRTVLVLPGRMVSVLLYSLKDKVSPELFELLKSCQKQASDLSKPDAQPDEDVLQKSSILAADLKKHILV